MAFVEASRSGVGLKGPEVETVRIEFLRQIQQPRPESSAGARRVYVQLINPSIVKDHQGDESIFAVDDPYLTRRQDDGREPLPDLIVGVHWAGYRRHGGSAGAQPHIRDCIRLVGCCPTHFLVQHLLAVEPIAVAGPAPMS